MAREDSDMEMYREIFENCPDILSVLDDQGLLLANSPASGRIHGYEPTELVGTSTIDYVHPDDQAGVQNAVSVAFRNPGWTVLIRYRYRNKDASWIWMEATGQVRPDDAGLMRLYSCSRDATSQVAAGEFLERTLHEKGELVKEIQHRVKNSIAMISSFVALEEGRVEDARLRGVLEDLRFRIDSVSNLYRLLFTASDPSTVDLKAYLERVVSDLVQTLDRPGVSTALDLAQVSIDTKRAGPLGILCTELVTNALRHAFDPGSPGLMEFSLVAMDDSLLIVVSDDGKGLPAGFDLEASEGLGLQLARMLAMQLKGKLVADARPGGGSRFTFLMPWSGQA